jgi:MFS family permease
MGSSDGRVAFRHANFRYYMMGRFLATVSSEMIALAVAWQIYSITHRPLDLGLVGLAQFLPGILLFLVTGHAADRVPRQRILQWCYTAYAVYALVLLGFSAQGLQAVQPIYAALLLNGVVRAFSGPASQAIMPLLVPLEDFPNAVAWGSSVFQGAMVLGPLVGGLIYGIAGRPGPVYACGAAAYLLALVLISMVRPATRQRITPSASFGLVLKDCGTSGGTG